MTHPELILGDHILSCKAEISHLGVALSMYGHDELLVEACIIKKYVGAVNSIVSWLGSCCQDDTSGRTSWTHNFSKLVIC